MKDSVTYQGKRYTADVRPSDRTDFDFPCDTYSSGRCAIDEPHSEYAHLVIGLAELAGTVEVMA